MNRTIRTLIVAAPLATIALTVVPISAATAGPNGPDVLVIKPKGGDPLPPKPQDKAPKPKPQPPKGPDKLAIPTPKPQPPKGPGVKAPKPQAQGPQVAAAPKADDTAAVGSAKGSADSIDRNDNLVVSGPAETELVADNNGGGMDLTWLLVGGGIVTASGIAFAARKRQQNA